MLKQRRFVVHWKSLTGRRRRHIVHWKSLNIPAVAGAGAVVVAVVASLAIALPASMASTHGAAGSTPARPDRARHPVSGDRPAAPGCLVNYASTSWPGQFTAKVTISNKGRTTIHGWTLTFRFPGDQAISGVWNATFTQTGTEVSARNVAFNTTIPRGASRSLGFQGVWRFNHTAPASFRVNGMACG
jgi:hypothetical protein